MPRLSLTIASLIIAIASTFLSATVTAFGSSEYLLRGWRSDHHHRHTQEHRHQHPNFACQLARFPNHVYTSSYVPLHINVTEIQTQGNNMDHDRVLLFLHHHDSGMSTLLTGASADGNRKGEPLLQVMQDNTVWIPSKEGTWSFEVRDATDRTVCQQTFRAVQSPLVLPLELNDYLVETDCDSDCGTSR